MDSNSSPETASAPIDALEEDSQSPQLQQLEQNDIQVDKDHSADETLPAPLGQHSDAIDQAARAETAQVPPPVFSESQAVPPNEDLANITADHAVDDSQEQNMEANSSTSLIPSMRSFATPSKSLPALKDIEPITTPKSFGVAKDDTHSCGVFKSSPVKSHDHSMQLEDLAETEEKEYDTAANDTFAHTMAAQNSNESGGSPKSTELAVAAAFLGVDPQAFTTAGPEFIAKLAQRAQNFSKLQSDLSFLKLNQEQTKSVQSKKFERMQNRLETLAEVNRSLVTENESASLELAKKHEVLTDLRSLNSSLENKLRDSQSLEQESKIGSATKESELIRLDNLVGSLTKANAEQGQRIGQLTLELNEASNESFGFKLELSKVANELSYTKSQKEWYENQLQGAQDKYTHLLKRLDSESMRDSNTIASLKAQNETLTAIKEDLYDQVKSAQKTIELTKSAESETRTKVASLSARFGKEIDANKESIELLELQLKEKDGRVTQLEEYANELKSSSAESVENLQSQLTEKDNQLISLEEQLRRAEEALDFELHKETQLPKLSPSAELILQEKSSGISLSTLYTEFNTVKKQLILEKSQKEKLAVEVQQFIAELNSRKPAIANYRNKILYYEETLKEVLAKSESIRIEKVESEKECLRLRSRLASHELELTSMKQLSKDLGRQLCFYLIHSKIREGDEDPLSSNERKVIDQILVKSGNKDVQEESDTDQIITERLLGFQSIIDLQKRNEELVIAVRQLGKELEERDLEPRGFEATAVEEAKEAILTLQSELESVTLKYEAICREKDLKKSLNEHSVSTDDIKIDVRTLKENNALLASKLQEEEQVSKTIQVQSEIKIKQLNDCLAECKLSCEDLKTRLSAANHSVDITENRLENTNKLIESARREINHSQAEISFWKTQTSKQEEFLVEKSNELRDTELKLSKTVTLQQSLQTEKEVWSRTLTTLTNEITDLRKDKDQLNFFVSNLQALLRDREESSTALSQKLTQTIENYQDLQERINEKEERIQILSSQSDLSLRAQNAKLEQMSELSQKLLDARSRIVEKELAIENLQETLAVMSKKSHTALHSARAPLDPSSNEESPILISEYNDLKDALKVAEAQVSEFSSIAKSAESALMNISASFDDLKESTDAKIAALESERNEYVKSLESQKQRVSELEKELNQQASEASSRIQDLQSKLQENASKADTYDRYKLDHDKKISAMNQDISNQHSALIDLQKRYEIRVSESDQLMAQLSRQKNDIEELQSESTSLKIKLEETETKLAIKEEQCIEQTSSHSENVKSAHLKLKDLQYQYDLALSQLELQKSSPEGDASHSSDDMRQLLSYLRAERDSAEAKAATASDEVTQLKTLLKGVSAELESCRSQMGQLRLMKLELEGADKDHARLMEQLEQLNILRESNITLRSENKTSLEKIKELQARVNSLATATSANVADTQADLHEQELKLLREENERLKNQPNRSDEIEALNERFTRVKSEYLTKLTNHRSKNKELEKQMTEIKSRLQDSEDELSKLKSSRIDDNESSALAAQLKEAHADKSQIEKAFGAQIEALKLEFEREREKLSSKHESELSKAVSSSNPDAEALEMRMREKFDGAWRQRLEKATSDLKARFENDLNKVVEQRVRERVSEQSLEGSKDNETHERIKNEYEAEIKILKKNFAEQLANEKANTEKSMSSMYELKLKMLNKRLEKYENGKASESSASNGKKTNPIQISTAPQGKGQAIEQNASENSEKGLANKAESPTKQSLNEGGDKEIIGKKRPNSHESVPSITFKRSKD